MKITKQARRDAKQLFLGCRNNGLLDEGKVRQTVQLVIAQKPRAYVAVLSHFQRLVKLDVARRTATVESAFALSPATRSSVEANLTQKYGPGLNLSFKENVALIGGLRVQVGSDVYDGSVQARLAALKDSL